MQKTRLEAFSDGVLAVIITIMVLELHIPQGDNLDALRPLTPIFLCYLLSFVFVGIYWNNHHHVLSAVKRISGGVLWANLHLLFWISLMPVATGWMGTHMSSTMPTVLYGTILVMSGFAYVILCRTLIRVEGNQSLLGRAIGSDRKAKFSLIAYALAIPAAFWHRWIAQATYVLVALVWLVPDRRIERLFSNQSAQDG